MQLCRIYGMQLSALKILCQVVVLAATTGEINLKFKLECLRSKLLDQIIRTKLFEA